MTALGTILVVGTSYIGLDIGLTVTNYFQSDPPEKLHSIWVSAVELGCDDLRGLTSSSYRDTALRLDHHLACRSRCFLLHHSTRRRRSRAQGEEASRFVPPLPLTPLFNADSNFTRQQPSSPRQHSSSSSPKPLTMLSTTRCALERTVVSMDRSWLRCWRLRRSF